MLNNSTLKLDSVALTQEQIKDWCKHNKLPAHVVDLSDLGDTQEADVFVFTGNEKNEFNDGADHHWLLAIDNYVFDSYGMEDYKLPKGFHFFEHSPKQLQPYNTNVCGEFCCLFYYHAKRTEPDLNGDKLAASFISRYHLGNKKDFNAKIVLEEFLELAPTSEAKSVSPNYTPKYGATTNNSAAAKPITYIDFEQKESDNQQTNNSKGEEEEGGKIETDASA